MKLFNAATAALCLGVLAPSAMAATPEDVQAVVEMIASDEVPKDGVSSDLFGQEDFIGAAYIIDGIRYQISVKQVAVVHDGNALPYRELRLTVDPETIPGCTETTNLSDSIQIYRSLCTEILFDAEADGSVSQALLNLSGPEANQFVDGQPLVAYPQFEREESGAEHQEAWQARYDEIIVVLLEYLAEHST